MRNLLTCLHHDESGVAFLEYTALLGVILAVGLGVFSAVGGWINSVWADLCTGLKIQC